MKVKIEKFNHQGEGITHINKKIIFIPNAIPDEKIDIEIIKTNKKYDQAIVKNIITASPKRIQPVCPYFSECGGCNLMHMEYKDTLEFKQNKVLEILSKYAKIKDIKINVIENKKSFNYRNKISLKIHNGKIGYYKKDTNSLVEIDKCLIAKSAINNLLSSLKDIKFSNGNITVRANYNDELLLEINDKLLPNININKLKENNKIVGIILNNKLISGNSMFIEVINNKYYEVSYNSFFQVNNYITNKIIKIVKEHISKEETILDLYCGGGLFSIALGDKVRKSYGIEIVPSSINNALKNAKINKLNNLKFILGDVEESISKINDKIDTIIIDPPRSGLDSNTIKNILNIEASKIIYVSCDPITLARDLKILDKYKIKDFNLLDAFSYTYHVESIVILEKEK